MRVLGLTCTRRDRADVDRYVDRSELPLALAEADAVVLTMPATPETVGILDAAALAAMKPSAYVVNVARGSLLDEPALVDALRQGRLAGAGLDAVAAEPLPADSPLWDLPNVLITPHQSPMTDRWPDHLTAFWAENIRRFADGEELLGAVHRDAGY
jgi:D-2-hydroxyacid dehydrogenase (NADP+)